MGAEVQVTMAKAAAKKKTNPFAKKADKAKAGKKAC